MIKKTASILTLFLMAALPVRSETPDNLSQRLSGRILLQIESKGEAWYVNPYDGRRYYLFRPADSFRIMRELSLGITNADLSKIPVGTIRYYGQDSDSDGLSDAFEDAVGTGKDTPDTDADGYADSDEIRSGYDPSGKGRPDHNAAFSKKNAGRFFIQTQRNGECWYVNPADAKRYYLGRPDDAFAVMRQLGLGIKNSNLELIAQGRINHEGNEGYPAFGSGEQSACGSCGSDSSSSKEENSPEEPVQTEEINESAGHYEAINTVAAKIRNSDTAGLSSYFTKNARTAVNNSMNFLDKEARFILGNIMSGARLSSEDGETAVYSAEIDWSGQKIEIFFRLKKQPDGQWLLENL
jgi:hypothetical protein